MRWMTDHCSILAKLDPCLDEIGHVIGLCSFGGGSQPSGSTTTTSTSAPWAGQQPYLTTGFQGAENLYQGAGPQYYPGTTVAPTTDAQTQAINSQENMATSGAPVTLANAAAGANTAIENGQYLNSNPTNSMLTPYTSGSMLYANNPYFQSMANTTAASITPQLESQFTAGGAMNSPGAAYATSQGLSDAIGNLAYTNYQQGQQNQLAATSQVGGNYNTGLGQMTAGLYATPGTQSALYTNPAEEYSAGATAQGLNQNQINAQIQQWNYNQTLPYQQLASYLGDVTGNYGASTSTTNPYFENSTANALGVGSGVLGALGAINNLTTAPGGGGSSGIIGGAISSLFSDPRLKKIKGLYGGALEIVENIPVHTARYKDEQKAADRPMIMATDVEKVLPHAVREEPVTIAEKAGVPKGLYSVIDGRDLFPVLIGSIQELNAKLNQLKKAA